MMIVQDSPLPPFEVRSPAPAAVSSGALPLLGSETVRILGLSVRAERRILDQIKLLLAREGWLSAFVDGPNNSSTLLVYAGGKELEQVLNLNNKLNERAFGKALSSLVIIYTADPSK